MWSVFNLHYRDMKKALENVLRIPDQEFSSNGDSYLEGLNKIFEERVNQSKEIVLSW